MEFVSGWQPVAVSAVTLSLLVVGVLFAFASVFDLRRLRVWARAEFMQVVVSGVLVGGLLAGSLALQSLSTDLAGGQEPIVFAGTYLNGVNQNIAQASAQLTVFTLMLAALQDVQVSIAPVGVGISGRPLAGLDAQLGQAKFILSALSFVSLTNLVQIYLLVFIQATMMYYFLPVGVVLRSFSLTRPVGAFMMALAVGLYFVFPLTFVFNAAAMEKMASSIDVYTESLKEFNEAFPLETLNFLDAASLGNFVVSLLTSAANSLWNQAVDALSNLAKLVAELVVQTTFFPLFNLGVVFLFVRSLYKALASEVVLWS
ncbi:hypothetical protein HY572_05715 [Candidatus Micrarchaeota archaeon]|nr:hypothetical protein [Candidatus Micrarchaeota archaeon]